MFKKYTFKQLNHEYKIINFMNWSYVAFSLSIILFIISIVIILMKGFNLGIDLTGGTIVEINLSHTIEPDKIRSLFILHGYKESIIQTFGQSKNIIIRLPLYKNKKTKNISRSIISIVHKNIDNQAKIQSIEFIGPSVGDELLINGFLALLLTLISILIYIGIRFEWKLAMSIIISLIHDLIIVLGIISLFQIDVEMTILASLISVLGYSLNDSIVVSDRIRENFRQINHANSYEIINISLTQTWNRTIITSGTALIVISMLYLFGGPVLKGFSLIMLIGITIGTISSIYITSALAFKMGIKRKKLIRSLIKEEENIFF